MRVSRKSWHYWVFSKMSDGGIPSSACDYWGTVLASPCALLAFAMIISVALPVFALGWCLRKVGWSKLKFSCPWKVEVVD